MEIKNRITVIKNALIKAKSEHDSFPKGRLRVSGKNPRYYKILERGDTQGIYLCKNDREEAKLLAQKDYNNSFIKKAEEELRLLEKIYKRLEKSNSGLAYQKLILPRKCLVKPYIETDELFAEEWQKKSYRSNPYKAEDKKYETRKGDLVRSKSEAIIADILYELKIPYRYEEEIKFRFGVTRYPDFTLLKIKTHEEIYLEHLGMLDSEEYRNANISKMDEYRSNGIYLGKNLLITYETEDSPLDIKGIRRMLKDIFLK